MEGCEQPAPGPTAEPHRATTDPCPQYLLCAFYPFTSSLFSFPWKSEVPATHLCSPPAHCRDYKGTRGSYMALSTVLLPWHAQQGGRNRVSLPSSPMSRPSPQTLWQQTSPACLQTMGLSHPRAPPVLHCGSHCLGFFGWFKSKNNLKIMGYLKNH